MIYQVRVSVYASVFEKSRWHDRWALILLSDEAPCWDVESGGRLHTL